MGACKTDGRFGHLKSLTLFFFTYKWINELFGNALHVSKTIKIRMDVGKPCYFCISSTEDYCGANLAYSIVISYFVLIMD